MFDTLLTRRTATDPTIAAALAEAAAAIARLDEALAGHPLRSAIPCTARSSTAPVSRRCAGRPRSTGA
jgi:hypothetical protein